MPDKVQSLEDCLDSEVLRARYRCPEGLVKFVLPETEGRSDGYFRFGESVVCFGQSSAGFARSGPYEPLYDALSQVSIHDSTISLPFDPAEVVANLQAERYQKGSGMKRWPGGELIRNGYYTLRPFMPVVLRKQLQKIYFRGWEQIRFPQWPIDVTVENVYEGLLRLALKARRGAAIPFIWFWPDGASSCAIVTHDVETQLGVDSCSTLMDLNDSFGIKSSFQVVPEERYQPHEAFLDEIRKRSFELNVHDLNHDGHLFRDKAEFLRRASRINEHALRFGSLGFRSAVMYRNADWMGALKFMYDMSFPNVSHLDPQRGGCCTVFPFFIGDMVELPVTMTQDYTLFHILGNYATDIWLEQSRRIRQKHGLLSVIVHPDYLDSQKAVDTYKGLLSHLAELRSAGQTWIALPRDVAAWWKQRNSMKLIQDGNFWRITGEGRNRARVAYAFLEGDDLRYELVGPASEARTSAFGTGT